jgi:hypothetical protein
VPFFVFSSLVVEEKILRITRLSFVLEENFTGSAKSRACEHSHCDRVHCKGTQFLTTPILANPFPSCHPERLVSLSCAYSLIRDNIHPDSSNRIDLHNVYAWLWIQIQSINWGYACMFNPYQLSLSSRNASLRQCPHELAPILVYRHEQRSVSSRRETNSLQRPFMDQSKYRCRISKAGKLC